MIPRVSRGFPYSSILELRAGCYHTCEQFLWCFFPRFNSILIIRLEKILSSPCHIFHAIFRYCGMPDFHLCRSFCVYFLRVIVLLSVSGAQYVVIPPLLPVPEAFCMRSFCCRSYMHIPLTALDECERNGFTISMFICFHTI